MKFTLSLLVLGFAFSAQASWDGIADSVHFYGHPFESNKMDFGRLPQRYMAPHVSSEAQRAGGLYGWSAEYARPYHEDNEHTANQTRRLARAQKLEMQGDFRGALKAYELLEAAPGFVQERREIYRAARSIHTLGLRKFFTYRALDYQAYVDFKVLTHAAALRTGKFDSRLKPFVQYALVDAESKHLGRQDADRYLDIIRNFPKSSRAESCLIMAIRSLLTTLRADRPTPDDIFLARKLIARLHERHPKSRFQHNAMGWLGRCEVLSGNLNKAANAYHRQLAASKNDHERWVAYDSLVHICWLMARSDKALLFGLRQWLLDVDMDRHIRIANELRVQFEFLPRGQALTLQKWIRHDPLLLEAYVGFRIEDTELDQRQESNMLNFATSALKTMKAPPAKLCSRVAQLSYNAGFYASAALLANRVLKGRPDDEVRGSSLYVLGASQYRLGKPKKALRSLEQILRLNVPRYLEVSAREYLALLNERVGDPIRSLELYGELSYTADFAYIADAKLTPEQLETFIDRRLHRLRRHIASGGNLMTYMWGYNHIADPNVMNYTLGMRYLRLDRYADARRVFRRMPKNIRRNWGMSPEEREALLDDDGGIGYDKAPPVRDPLEVVDKLERWTYLSKQAKTREKRAQALYDKAAYIYRERNLLFYSPGLWGGTRGLLTSLFWSDATNDKADNAVLARHIREHECLYHSYRLLEELLRKYPESPLVPKALYTSALSVEHLNNLNSAWPHDTMPDMQIAVNRLYRLHTQFPNHPLAKSALKYKHEFVAQLRRPQY